MDESAFWSALRAAATAEIELIQGDAEREVADIEAASAATIAAEREQTLAAATARAELEAEALLRRVDLGVRHSAMTARQAAVDAAFAAAAKRLDAAPAAQTYREALTELLREAIGELEAAADATAPAAAPTAWVDAADVPAVQEAAQALGAELAVEPIGADGGNELRGAADRVTTGDQRLRGVVLVSADGSCVVRNTLRERFQRARARLDAEVTDVLFAPGHAASRGPSGAG